MEAKDTVMDDSIINGFRKRFVAGEWYGTAEFIYAVAQAQAEISFKAGLREVVEWMNEAMAFTDSGNLPLNTLRVDFKYDKWQAKLKEWGVNND